MYFDQKGAANTDQTLTIAFARAKELGIKDSQFVNIKILGEKGGIVEDENLKVCRYENGNIVEEIVPVDNPEWFRFYFNIADHLLLGEELEIKVEMARRVIGVIEKTIISAEKGKPVKFE